MVTRRAWTDGGPPVGVPWTGSIARDRSGAAGSRPNALAASERGLGRLQKTSHGPPGARVVEGFRPAQAPGAPPRIELLGSHERTAPRRGDASLRPRSGAGRDEEMVLHTIRAPGRVGRGVLAKLLCYTSPGRGHPFPTVPVLLRADRPGSRHRADDPLRGGGIHGGGGPARDGHRREDRGGRPRRLEHVVADRRPRPRRPRVRRARRARDPGSPACAGAIRRRGSGACRSRSCS